PRPLAAADPRRRIAARQRRRGHRRRPPLGRRRRRRCRNGPRLQRSLGRRRLPSKCRAPGLVTGPETPKVFRMAEVQPFRAWRNALSQVASLPDVTAPPYDVINPALQKQLYELHPCNVVRLILNRAEPGDDGPADPYRRAAN